ncbi:hypothetical protein F4775DRAFT_596561 [Biscogniauxia sp. FL1348]|nr:hypothetical protein F4775DRAFT_596561 [Biscogniauxia sp. FL1348]
MASDLDPDSEYISKYDDIVNAPDDSQGALTFGIELEFLLASVEGNAFDPNPEESRPLLRTSKPDDGDIFSIIDIDNEVKEYLVNVLRHKGGLTAHSAKYDDFHLPHDNVPIYDEWRITYDRSVMMHKGIGPDSYRWHGREISSVVLSSDDPKYPEKVEHVCRALRQARIHLNETTSVHVHVGRGEEPFSFLTIKKFATLYWLTEEKILSLQHPCRKSSRYCYLLTRLSNLAAETSEGQTVDESDLDPGGLEDMKEFVPPQLPTLLETQLRKIWGCMEIEDLAILMQGCPTLTAVPRGAVGFKRFLPAGNSGGNTQTFEWRQMAGSLDPESIIKWVRVCIAFTDFARTSSAEEFSSLLSTILERENSYTGFDLLQSLGLHAEAEYFKKKVDGYAQNQDIYPGQGAGKLFLSPL